MEVVAKVVSSGRVVAAKPFDQRSVKDRTPHTRHAVPRALSGVLNGLCDRCSARCSSSTTLF